MELFLEKMIDSLIRHSRLKLLLIFFAITEIFVSTLDYLMFYIAPVKYTEALSSQVDFFSAYPLIFSIIIVTLIVPIIETLIFQILLLLILKKLTEWIFYSNSWIPSLALTTLTFAAVHGIETKSLYLWSINAIMRIPLAFFLALLAIIEYEKEHGLPILSVFFLHALYNAFETILFLASAE